MMTLLKEKYFSPRSQYLTKQGIHKYILLALKKRNKKLNKQEKDQIYPENCL